MPIPKISNNLPAIFSALTHLLSAAGLPLLNHFLLQVLKAPPPVSLAFLQMLIPAICLWFWSIFGLFRVRLLPIKQIIPLALSAAISSLASTLALSTNSLLIYQSLRSLSPLFPVARVSPLPKPPTIAAIIASILLTYSDPSRTPIGITMALLSTLAAAFHATLAAPAREAVNASELQLHLITKSVASTILFPLVFFVDAWGTTLPTWTQEEVSPLLISASGMLAFFAFVAARATADTLNRSAQHVIAHGISAIIFAAHFVSVGGIEIFQAIALFILTWSMATIVEYADTFSRKSASESCDSISSLSIQYNHM